MLLQWEWWRSGAQCKLIIINLPPIPYYDLIYDFFEIVIPPRPPANDADAERNDSLACGGAKSIVAVVTRRVLFVVIVGGKLDDDEDSKCTAPLAPAPEADTARRNAATPLIATPSVATRGKFNVGVEVAKSATERCCCIAVVVVVGRTGRLDDDIIAAERGEGARCVCGPIGGLFEERKLF